MVNKQGKLIFALISAALLLAAVWVLFRPSGGATTEKEIYVTVVFSEKSTQTHTIATNAEFLREALEEYDLIEGDESAYGLFVTSVAGVQANPGLEQWWCFTKGGESLTTGVDSTPILNGDQFEITLMTGY